MLAHAHDLPDERFSPGEAAIALPADPNGLAYDRARRTLYVADGETGAVLAIAAGRHRRLAVIDGAGTVEGNQLGGVAVGPGGRIFVARLGHGHAGAVFQLDAAGRTPPRALDGLCPRPWRLGVAYAAGEHALYATQYAKRELGPCDGAVMRISLATGEVTAAVTDLIKPVGVAVLEPAALADGTLGGASRSTLVVTDARQRAVMRVELEHGREVARVALASHLDRPDSIAAAGPDSVVVTTFDPDTRRGAVRRIWLDGRVQLVAQGRWEPRGVATDGERVYVAARRMGCVLMFAL